MEDAPFLWATICQYQKDRVLIKTEDGQDIFWPINKIPDQLNPQGKIRLKITSEKTEQQEREKIAKLLLNKILTDGQES